MIDETYHDEDTLSKVYAALKFAGLDEDRSTFVIIQMHNAGILFRERIPDPPRKYTGEGADLSGKNRKDWYGWASEK